MDSTHYVGDGCVPPHLLPSDTAIDINGFCNHPGLTCDEADVTAFLNKEAPHGLMPVVDIQRARDLLKVYTGLRPDEHGGETPKRFLAMLDELTACKDDSDEHLLKCIKWKDFASDTDEMIISEALPFVSVCNHHVIPFIGVAHIAYVPAKDGRMAGLSKFGRVVQHFARRLQVQERLTAQIAGFLEGTLKPRGVGVVVRAEHMCMTIRGLRAPGTYTTTSAMRGVFADHERTAKFEFLSFVNGNGRH